MKIRNNVKTILLLVTVSVAIGSNSDKVLAAEPAVAGESPKPAVISVIKAVTPDNCVKTSGRAVFKQDPDDSLGMFLSVQIKQTLTSSCGDIATGIEGLYFPGVRHVFWGRCHMPVAPAGFEYIRLDTNIHNVGDEPFGFVVMEGGRRGYSGGPIVIKGPGEAKLKDLSSTLDIIPEGSSYPMVFLVTEEGYEYVAGTGTMQIPSGEILSFP